MTTGGQLPKGGYRKRRSPHKYDLHGRASPVISAAALGGETLTMGEPLRESGENGQDFLPSPFFTRETAARETSTLTWSAMFNKTMSSFRFVMTP